jgi:hypothetical protein
VDTLTEQKSMDFLKISLEVAGAGSKPQQCGPGAGLNCCAMSFCIRPYVIHAVLHLRILSGDYSMLVHRSYFYSSCIVLFCVNGL